MSKFAVLVEESITYPDPYEDERSGSTITTKYTSLQEFADEEELKAWIARNDEISYGYKKKFRVIKFEELTVTKEVKFTVQ